MKRILQTLPLISTLILSGTGCNSDEEIAIVEEPIDICYQNLLDILPYDFEGTACGICSAEGVLLSDSLILDDKVEELGLISVFYSYDQGLVTYQDQDYDISWEVLGDGLTIKDDSHSSQLSLELAPTFSQALMFARSKSSEILCSSRVLIVDNSNFAD